MSLRRFSLALASLALVGIACTCPATAVLQQITERVEELPNQVDELPPLSEFAEREPASEIDPSSPDDPQPEGSIPREVLDQMAEIEGQVVALRGLQPSGPVDRALLSPQQLRQHVLEDFFEDYSEEEAVDDVRTLSLLGLIEPDYDLYNLYIDLYSEQVAGFYDDEIKQMFVVQGERFAGSERLTYAHEYVHALQDQRYDLSDGLGYNDEACEADSERCAGLQSLVEGDATLLEQQWLLTYATDQDWRDLQEFIDSFQSPVFDSAPLFLQDDFLFPYDFGFSFVDQLFTGGGWAAVDAAYVDPPTSTEQILHPDRYPEDRPVWLEVPELESALGSDWREIDQDVLGEWYTRLTLQEQLIADDAEVAAEGWGGDYFVALFSDTIEQGALVLLTQWDTVRDAHEFFAEFLDYGDSRFGDRLQSTTTGASWEGSEEYATFELRGDQTLWILAPDAAIAESLRGAIDFPAAQADGPPSTREEFADTARPVAPSLAPGWR